MQAQVTPLDASKATGITFTDKPVTAFGGLALFVAFAERICLATKLAEVLPFVLTSPNATPPHHIVLAFLAGVLAGARRFAHLAVLQADVPVRQIGLLGHQRDEGRNPGKVLSLVQVPV